MSSNKLPPTDDPERTAHEREALYAAKKTQEIAQALGEGKLPTTTQLTTAITEFQESDVLHESTKVLSPLGKRVLVDTENLLETTKQVMEEKNAGDQLQNVMFYGNRVAQDLGDTPVPELFPEHLKQKISGESATATTLAQKTASKVGNVVRLLIASSEFRKLVNDIHSILQTAIAAGVSQSQKTTGTGVNTGADTGVDTGLKDVRAGINTAEDSGVNIDIGNDLNSGIGSDVNTRIGSDVNTRIGSGEEKTVKQATAETTGQLKEAGEVFQETKLRDLPDKLKDSLNQGTKVIKESFMDDKHRTILAQRFQGLAQEASSNPEFQEAISDLIEIASHLSETAVEVTKIAKQQVTSTAENAQDRLDDSEFEIVKRNAKELLENFANGKSLDPLSENLRELATRIREDEKLASYFHQLKTYVLRSVREPEFIKQGDYIEQGSQLIKQGRDLLLDHYGPLTQHISHEFAQFNQGLQEDSSTTRLRKDLEILTRDLFLDERGRPTIKLELIKDFAKILPIFAQKFEYIVLPKIEGDDDDYEYIFENIVVHLKDIVPKHVHLNFTADVDLDRPEEDRLQNTITIDIAKMQADARNIPFFYKKKKGLVTLLDVGLVDFAIPEESGGFSVHQKIRLNVPGKENAPIRFDVIESRTQISELKLRLHDTKNHDILYKILKPWVEGTIRRRIEQEINEKLKDAVSYIQDSIGNAQKFYAKKEGEATTQQLIPTEEQLKTREPWASPAFDTKTF